RGLVWDTGTVLSARQAFVAYGGPSLAADAAYEWTVQPRGPAGRWGPVSAPSRFTTALRAADWRAPRRPPAAWPGRPWGAGLGPVPLHDGAAGGRLAGPVAAARRRFPATRPRHVPAHRGHARARRLPRNRLRVRGPHLPSV